MPSKCFQALQYNEAMRTSFWAITKCFTKLIEQQNKEKYTNNIIIFLTTATKI